MPFIPHTQAETEAMLDTIGVGQIDELFEEIPETLHAENPENPFAGMGEMEIGQLMRERSSADDGVLCFAGGGAYQHHIPAAVWELATRGEFYTAYTQQNMFIRRFECDIHFWLSRIYIVGQVKT